MPRTIKKIGKLGALASLVLATGANAADIGEYNGTKVTLKGFIKFDAMMTDYSDGNLPSNNLGRDFYIPSLTPVEGDGATQTTQFDMHVKTSRFGLGTATKVDGTDLKTYIEMDFAVGDNGNERISNSYQARLRHAFIQYGKWTLGQTWTTFMNVGALPESVDFIGNTDAGIFGRQVVARYTNGPWQFAVENPEATVTDGGRVITDDNSVPDIVARYNYNSDRFNFVVAALVRQLTYDNGSNIDDSTNSYGVSFSGKVKVGEKNDFKFAVNTGTGMGRYIGLNISNGAVVDGNGDLEAIDSTGLYAAYRHHWSDKWRSSFIYSRIDIDNDVALTGTGASAESERAAVNLFYQAASKLKIGGEISRANREEESGADGSMTRFQLTAVLSF